MLRRRLERERVDRHLLVPQAEFEVAPSQQRGQLSVAVAEIEDDGQRLVLLRVRDEEVQEKALAAARGAQHQRVPDVLDVQVERVRRLVRRLEDGQRLALEVGAHAFALIEREQEAQIRGIRFQQRQPPQVVRAVPRDDAQPGVQQVVGLLEDGAVVDGNAFLASAACCWRARASCAVQDQRQRTLPEEVPVDLRLGQRVAELPDRGAVAESSTSISSGLVSGAT